MEFLAIVNRKESRSLVIVIEW